MLLIAQDTIPLLLAAGTTHSDNLSTGFLLCIERDDIKNYFLIWSAIFWSSCVSAIVCQVSHHSKDLPSRKG